MTATSRAIIACLGLAIAFAACAVNDKSREIEISDASFKCLGAMKPVRGFFVDNLLGNVDETARVANSPAGGRYPPGSVVQLIPGEAMVKHRQGWNPATNDWEFFELDVSPAGSKVRVRGVAEVVNRFNGNCFGCHVRARPEWDLICETDHGCLPLPFTAAQIAAVQESDPRCTTPPRRLSP